MAPKRDLPDRLTPEGAPALVYVDTELRVRFASRHCHEILGHDPGTLHGRLLRELVDTATLRFAREHVAEVERGAAPTREYALRRKDGTKMLVHVSAVADRDAAGCSVGYLLRTEPDARQRFSMPLEAAEASFWVWDLPTRREHYSRGFKELLGYSEAEFPPQFRFFGAMHPEDRDAIADALATAIRGGRPFDCEFRLRGADGGWRWIRGIGQAAPDAGGAAATRFQCVAHDISQRKRPEVLAAANHALRTPLASVIAALELLRDEAVPASATTPESLVSIALENAAKLATVVEQWLDIERIDTGAALLRNAPLELEAIVAATVEQLGDLRGGTVRFHSATAGKRVRVSADRTRLQQALSHLIGAALERSAPGCPVTVRLAVRDGRGVVEVDDEAPHPSPGCDLGLLVAEAIVKRCNGDLRVALLPGNGTRVVVALPCLDDIGHG